MLQIVEAIADKYDIQYIAMLNEHDVASMRPMEPESQVEFDRVFHVNNVVLTLTDQSSKDRLLGIDVDMDYTSRNTSRSGEEFVEA